MWFQEEFAYTVDIFTDQQQMHSTHCTHISDVLIFVVAHVHCIYLTGLHDATWIPEWMFGYLIAFR